MIFERARMNVRLAVVLIFCGLVTSCWQPKQQADICIGLITTLSGDYAVSGQATLEGAKLAVNEVNDAGGLNVGNRKHRVSLITEDNQDSPDVSVNAGRKLIYQKNVVALVGPNISRNAIPVAIMAEKARIPMISPISSNPETTAGKQFVFRVTFVDDFQGSVLARFASDDLRVRKAAVLYDAANTYNKGIAMVFKQAFEEAGGQVVGFESYTSDDNKDFTGQLERIRDSGPELLFLPNYGNEVSLQIKQARQMGLDATILGSDGWEGHIFCKRPEFEGTFFSYWWHPDIANEHARNFVKAYRRSYDHSPVGEAALTYDAFSLLFRAIESQGSVDPEAIRRGLSGIERHPGVSGTISYRGSGDPEKSVVILQIQNGKVNFYKSINP